MRTGTLNASQEKPTETSKPSSKKTSQQGQASDGVRAFMAAQRSRLQSSKTAEPVKKDERMEPIVKRPNVLTGAQRYKSHELDPSPTTPNLSNLKSVIQQAKTSGRLALSNRALDKLPDQIITMYHVDPKSVVVDFSSSDHAWYDFVDLTKFVASDNQLEEIDERLGEEFGALTHVDFRNNRLSSLPLTFGRLQQLTVLDLSHNRFNDIPPALFQLTQLRDLNLSNNAITMLPQEIQSLQALELVNLSNNAIGPSLPKEIVTLTRLKKLQLEHNKLTDFPLDWFVACPYLFDLTLSNNRLATLMTVMTKEICLPNLQRLDVRHNRLYELPDQLQMPKLKEMFLADNALVTPSKSGYQLFENCPLLVTLDVSSNKWTRVPDSIMTLQSLERLDVGANQLLRLHPELGLLPELKVLSWEGNPLRSAPRGTSMIQLLTSLRISYENGNADQDDEDNSPSAPPSDDSYNTAVPSTTNVPAAAPSVDEPLPGQTTQLQLDLSKRQWTEIQTNELGKYRGVKVLQLQQNMLKVMNLCDLSMFIPTLVTLSLDNNKLDSFPLMEPHVVFPCLKTLHLANNQIKEFGVDGAESSFPALNELKINNNLLAQLPDRLSTIVLPSLRVLLANGNRLESLDPDSVTQLEVLDIGNNELMVLPPRLGLVTSIRELTVYGNRFRVPQPSLLSQGTAAVMTFLRRRAGVQD
ncbi:L domain-like protein [Hesseltinella vesiculosa]|uniref:L domain-like protein n=1 Tax=Hesseltinella vesiculosa TaxID=101127 RepID=A0A1X2GBN4_9FUNG|nr:L domain-like protein [Hesseltinella vesiculosa]